jgi:uncharacterized RDD family membrane protein YckC
MKFLRILSRLLDYSAFALLAIPLTLLFHLPYSLLVSILLLSFIPIEAFLLANFAVTPAKALFGITLRDRSGRNLTFSNALRWALFLRRKRIVYSALKIGPFRKGLGFSLLAFSLTLLFSGKTTTEIAAPFAESFVNKHVVPDADWISFTCDSKKFSIDFPTKPSLEKRRLEVAKYKKAIEYFEYASLPNKDTAYCVGFIDIPAPYKWFASRTILHEALKTFVENTPGTELISQELTYHDKNRAIDFHLKQNGLEVIGRFIVAHNTLYRLHITYHPSQAPHIEKDNFIDSFELE